MEPVPCTALELMNTLRLLLLHSSPKEHFAVFPATFPIVVLEFTSCEESRNHFAPFVKRRQSTKEDLFDRHDLKEIMSKGTISRFESISSFNEVLQRAVLREISKNQGKKETNTETGVNKVWQNVLKEFSEVSSRELKNQVVSHYRVRFFACQQDSDNLDTFLWFNIDIASNLVKFKKNLLKLRKILNYEDTILERRVCYTCNKQGKRLPKCEGCLLTRYCNKKCQLRDWPSHQERCGQSRELHILLKLIQTRKKKK